MKTIALIALFVFVPISASAAQPSYQKYEILVSAPPTSQVVEKEVSIKDLHQQIKQLQKEIKALKKMLKAMKYGLR